MSAPPEHFRARDPSGRLFAVATGLACVVYLAMRALLHPELLRGDGAADLLIAWLFRLPFAPVPDEVGMRAALAALVAFAAPLLAGAVWFWRRRIAALRRRPLPPTPEGRQRQLQDERDLPWQVMTSYLLHLLLIALPFLGMTCAQRLGPPGGGGGEVGEEEQEEMVQVVQVLRRKLVVNPHSAVLLHQPKEVPIELKELTQRLATAQQAGGAGAGSGGYEGGEGEQLRFVTLDHGGAGWDEADAVAAPNLLRELRARLSVPTPRRPDVVTVRDLAAQRDPDQQPSLVYLCMGAQGPRLAASDHAFLARYCLEIGGLLLLDDTGGGRRHAEHLARTLFPGRPLVAVAADDPLFSGRQDLGHVPLRDRALARHGGDRVLGVRDGDRWVLVYHPGDLVDGWRGAYGQAWQEIAYRFGVNVFDYATKRFLATRRAAAPTR